MVINKGIADENKSLRPSVFIKSGKRSLFGSDPNVDTVNCVPHTKVGSTSDLDEEQKHLTIGVRVKTPNFIVVFFRATTSSKQMTQMTYKTHIIKYVNHFWIVFCKTLSLRE